MKILAVVPVVLLVSCASTGTEVDPNVIKQFTVGKTTAAEAIALLGPPSMTTETNGHTFHVWSYGRSSLVSSKAVTIQLMFSKAGVLTRKTSSSFGS